jgi:hypothetical protein
VAAILMQLSEFARSSLAFSVFRQAISQKRSVSLSESDDAGIPEVVPPPACQTIRVSLVAQKQRAADVKYSSRIGKCL